MPPSYPHISGEFRHHFPDWASLTSWVAARATIPEFDAHRAISQLLTADILQRLVRGGGEWILFGSLGLPCRPPAGAPWPADFQPAVRAGVHPAYLMCRPPFDFDIHPRHLVRLGRDPAESGRLHGHAVVKSVDGVVGTGLGGLVEYSHNDLRVLDTGQVTGVITAQPTDRRTAIAIELDIQPAMQLRFMGPPDHAARPVVALDVPGMQPFRPLLYPLENQLADKIVLLANPPSGRHAEPGPWHRWKDLFDLYFAARTCRLDGAKLSAAIAMNWNWEKFPEAHLARPYRVYGQAAAGRDEPEVPWSEGCGRFSSRWPEYRLYPPFAGMMQLVSELVDGIAGVTPRTWIPGLGWQNHILRKYTGSPSHVSGRAWNGQGL